MKTTRRSILAGLAAAAGSAAVPRIGAAQTYGSEDYGAPVHGSPDQPARFSQDEILNTGHQFFGSISRGIAEAMEHLFQHRGRPNGYILGEEGGGAFIAGVRYGEGWLRTKNAGSHKIYWQGPSIGWDLGADGARTMMLVYNLHQVDDIYRMYTGVNGSAYLVAGAGASVYANNDTLVAPIRSGVGARVGLNIGYLRFTNQPTWNPL